MGTLDDASVSLLITYCQFITQYLGASGEIREWLWAIETSCLFATFRIKPQRTSPSITSSFPPFSQICIARKQIQMEEFHMLSARFVLETEYRDKIVFVAGSKGKKYDLFQKTNWRKYLLLGLYTPILPHPLAIRLLFCFRNFFGLVFKIEGTSTYLFPSPSVPKAISRWFTIVYFWIDKESLYGCARLSQIESVWWKNNFLKLMTFFKLSFSSPA